MLINISVIIPTLNAGLQLEKLLAGLNKQNQVPQEIIVIDSGSTDNTLSIAKAFGAKVEQVPYETFDHGGTRNIAARKAKGDILVFMTQDVVPVNNSTLHKLLTPVEAGEAATSYARQVALSKASPGEQYLRSANYPPQSRVKTKETIADMGIKAFQCSNACAAYEKETFFELGGFPEPVACNEDMLFSAKAIFNGYRVAYCADAVVWHTHSFGPVSLFRRYFDIAASLDYEPRIREVGRAGSKGFEFFNGYLSYLKQNNKLYHVPVALLETAARYAGYKAGENHRFLSPAWKKNIGMNTTYWNRYI